MSMAKLQMNNKSGLKGKLLRLDGWLRIMLESYLEGIELFI